ncbi:hypothetical protein C0991_008403 [Blastosporella zonata]|nr:hypothetical protein C0991_008403 [Blastosporella zonata]
MASPASPPALARLEAILRQVMRVTVSDGRIFLGTFAGTDQPLNLLLVNAEEFRLGAEENPDGRYVGQIVIPWKLVVKVEAERKEGRHIDNHWFPAFSRTIAQFGEIPSLMIVGRSRIRTPWYILLANLNLSVPSAG